MRERIVMVLALVMLGSLSVRPAEAQPQLVGSFMVGDGPSWDTNPTVTSCVDACAALFGGAGADYSCSTSDTSIDHQAWLDGWGDPWSYCTDVPGPEDFVVGTNYDCGSVGCSYSAYVNDHSCMMPNYCWAEQETEVGVCGDGTLDAGEACDDGNTEDGDCCASTCQYEPSGSSCSDGDVCNGAEICGEAGECQAGKTLECDDGDPCTRDSCDEVSGCMVETGPAEVCSEATSAELSVNRRLKTLEFDWKGTASLAEFGDPVTKDATALCLYDAEDAFIGSLAVGAGGKCGKHRPCWKAYSTGFVFTDYFGKQDGVRALKLKAGEAGRGRISLDAWGGDIRDLDLGDGPASTIRAQVVNDSGACFEASFEASEHKVCRRGKVKAKHRH